MLKLETLSNWLGYKTGDRYNAGEYYYSQGMRRSQLGVLPGWACSAAITSSSLTSLNSAIQIFTEINLSGTNYVFGVDTAGNIYRSEEGYGAWALVYSPGQSTYGNGLIGGQNNVLYYLMERYMGKYDGTADYTTGTIAVNNGSANIVGTGTTFVSGDVGKRIVISGVYYTIATYTDATHITISVNYAGSNDAAATYAIKRGWTDTYKDLGSGSLATANDPRDADTFEDWVVMSNGNDLALFNVTDSSFNATAFTVPSQGKIRSVKSGRNGILAGVNFSNRSALLLWDAQQDRSLNDWLWLDSNIQAIVKYDGNWIVVTSRRLYLTNGYTITQLTPYADEIFDSLGLGVGIQGGVVVGKYLVLSGGTGLVNRKRVGIHILDLEQLLWEFCPFSGVQMNVSFGGIFFDSNIRTHVSWATSTPALKNIGYFGTGLPSSAYLITQPMGAGNNKKVCEALKLNLGISQYDYTNPTYTFKAAVKVAPLDRQLWQYATQKAIASEYDELTIDGTVGVYADVEVGDEVTIMEGANAGQIRHIISITGQNTTTEVWTLDSALANYTESGVFLVVQPFKLAREVSITNATRISDLWFGWKNKYTGRRFLIKIVLTNLSTFSPEIVGGDFMYDDLGFV